MQGSLAVSSAPEKGSIFQFTLKVGMGGEAPNNAPELKPEFAQFGIERLNGAKILVVDSHAVRQVTYNTVKQSVCEGGKIPTSIHEWGFRC